jgi:hypothetical protein
MDMNINTSNSYVVNEEAQIPLHLRDRVPFVLGNTEAILRLPEAQTLDSDGRVKLLGSIEFQTQITPGRLTDVCDPDELFKPEMRLTHRFRCVYDPDIQRGVKDADTARPKEFLNQANIKSMMQDIEQNRFECPQLMWNLRASETVWVYVRTLKSLRIYEGVATRPDTNHRHHAIVGMQRKYLDWVKNTGSTVWGDYNPHRAYGLVIYTDSAQGEGHRFYVYNFKGWRVSTSTAHYIESKTDAPQLHSRLARELMESSGILTVKNVEVLSNQHTRNSAKMITFGTLVDALKGAFPGLTEDNHDATLNYLITFLDELHKARPNEISLLSVAQRQAVREATVADQAVLWHAYFKVAARLRDLGISDIDAFLAALQTQVECTLPDDTKVPVDILSRQNAAWQKAGVIAPGKTGPRVVNNRQAREGACEYLCELMQIPAKGKAASGAAPAVVPETDEGDDDATADVAAN